LGTKASASWLAALVLGGCTASIGDKGTGTTTGAVCTTNPGGPAGDPGPAPVRRVTRLEYDNTVRDLLGTSQRLGAAFPPEERRLGFDNNAAALSVSPLLAEQYLDAAEALAAEAVDTNWAALVPCDPAITGMGVDACGQQFIAAFGQRAYRRPLDADDTAVLTAVFDAGKATDFKTGVRLVIETVLQAPKFLYRIEQGVPPTEFDLVVPTPDVAANAMAKVVRLDDWEMAARLSYMLWRSMPDDELYAAAQAGRLSSADGVATEVVRMLADPRARGMVTDFHDQWLRIGEVDGVEKDAGVFPAFTPAVAGLLRTEAETFMDHVVWEGEGTLAALLTAPYTFVNGPLAQYYGMTGDAIPTGPDFVRVDVDPTRRAGFLTQGGLVALLSKANQTSPVQRGKFVREQLLCDDLPPPPAGVDITPPELSATLTTRQRFEQHSADPSCATCHHLMDPIGLGFERFDGAGMLRDTENGQPIDASGRVDDADVAGPFDGVPDLAGKLAASGQVRDCAARSWFRYGYGRGETAGDACTLQALQQAFAQGNRIQTLLVAMTATDAFLYRRVTPPSGGSSP
jgi:hypothetical protein